MSELAAVFGDEDTHGGGALLCTNTAGKMYVQGKLIALVDSSAEIDDLLHTPIASTGSSKMYVNGFQVHRNNDLRSCGASTIVTGQTKLYVN